MTLQSQQTRIVTITPPGAGGGAPLSCVSSPAANTTLSSGDTAAGGGGGAAMEGSKVYALGQNTPRLLVYDVSNPAAMSKVGDQLLNAGAFAVNQPAPTAAIGVLSSKAYIANYPNAGNVILGVYDCTNPGAITQAGTFTLGGAGTTNGSPRRVGVFTVGADTFAAVGFNDIVNILKCTNPAAITSVATVTVPDVAGNGVDGVFVFNKVLFATTNGLSTGDFRAKAWSVSTPSAPSLLWDTAITYPAPFTLPDVYVANQNGLPVAVVVVQSLVGHGGLQILNGQTGAILGQVVFISSLAVAGDGQAWVDPVAGGCCEVTLKNGATLRLVNISDPTNPSVVSDVSLSGQYNTVAGPSSGTATSVFSTGTVGGGDNTLKIESITR